MAEFTLRDHQMALLQMLKEIDRICKKHNIRYMLFAGTVLGAVRHKGFIPWDDDLDIVMTRDQYEKFLSVAQGEIDTDVYFLQKEFSEHWPCFFSKLRKNNTAYMEKMIPKDKKQHQGIYVDIFPCDNLRSSVLARKWQFAASKVVIAKALWKRGYLTDSIKKKLFIAGCCFLPSAVFRAIARGDRYKNSKMVHTFFGASSRYEKSIYPREWFEDVEYMEFEGTLFPVPKHYDELLTALYGDYMTPPSEEQREVKVHAMKIDLENSYENYIEWQENQKIDVYTRSIR